MNEYLAAALQYAERGWSVFANCMDGGSTATTNPSRIRKYYAKNPDAGVKVHLRLSRLVVLQVKGDEGIDSLINLGMPPETLRAKVSDTASDLFFQASDVRLKSGEVAEGLMLFVDLWAIVPPTNGSVWINDEDEPAAPFPKHLVAAKIEKDKQQQRTEQASSRNEWPKPLDLVALSQREPEPPRFVMDDWLPCGYATLFAGHGGVGKSGVALHLAVCIAAGLPFFGLRVARRRVLYLSCEDRANILHWRLTRICAFLRIDLANLAGWLEILDLVGQPTVLWERDQQSGNSLTMSHSNLHSRIRAGESQVLIADGIADTFGGNENSRTEVKAFVNSLLALVPPDEGAVLLVGHISKPVASNSVTSEGYSGSTGWHNSVRARWYFYPERDTGSLKLELQKSNLGPTDRAMNFRWDAERHLFVGAAVTDFDSQQRDEEERAGIIAAMKACPVPVPTATTGKGTTFNVLSIRPEFPPTLMDVKGKSRFWRHIEVLRQTGVIAEGEIPAPGYHKKSIWIVRGGF